MTQNNRNKKEVWVLTFSVFIAGLCSIVYELLIATTSSYFLGDSITQFSLTIGVYMAAMGVGSYLSRLIGDERLLARFIKAEIALALLGGASVPLLYLAFALTDSYQTISLLLTFAIGTLIGLEIPLLSRLMSNYYQLKMNISNIMSVDYFGALIATLLFPFVLLPFMGVFRSSLTFGLANLSIAVVTLWCFADTLGVKRAKILKYYWIGSAVVLGGLFIFAKSFIDSWSSGLYTDRIIHRQQTPYQEIVLTKYKEDVRLYLNGSLQFSAMDEYRYHEALVHLPMRYVEQPNDILLLGAGDGLAVRELLKYDSVGNITLVDLDPAITALATNNNHVSQLNQASLESDKLQIIHHDAFKFLNEGPRQYDFIIIDLPDPKSTALARFYSKEFYQLIHKRLKPQGVFVTQATSPIYAKNAFWSIKKSIQTANFAQVHPYHLNVPSFGEWGFVMAAKHPHPPQPLPSLDNRLVTEQSIQHYLFFDKDMKADNAQVSTLDRPKVLSYYLDGWKYWN